MSVEFEAATDAAWASVLSERELEVALLVACGASNKDVACQLKVTEPTVKQHMHHIFRKLGLASRYKLILQAQNSMRPAGNS
jgi:DNA-binding NarL/FixJ family response regulator